MKRVFNQDFMLFVVVGAINSILGYALYLLLLMFVNYALAWSTAYITGIFASYYLNSRFVFHEPLSLVKALRYPLVYVVQYGLGVLFLYILVDLTQLDSRLAPLLVIVLTLPFTFILSRTLIRGRGPGSSANTD